MAIEIKELIIKVSVNKSINNPTSLKGAGLSSVEKKELIKECVEKVLEKIDLKSIR
jgi:hypothetical protein